MWEYSGLNPKYLCKWRFLMTCNIITGCTMMFNKGARNISLRNHNEASMHDSWIGLNVAANGGIIVCLNIQTILYRQHGTNTLGAPPQVGMNFLKKRILNIHKTIKEIIAQWSKANKIKSTSFVYFMYNKMLYQIIRTNQR